MSGERQKQAPMETPIPVSCNKDCIGGCPLVAYVEHGRITRIRTSPHAGPYMTGCIKGFQAARTLYAPDRLRSPLLRTGPRGSGQFRELAWPEALDIVAERLAGIKARYGAQAILRLGGSGSCRGALHNTQRLTARFLSLLGPCADTYGSYSSAAASFVTPFVLGTNMAGIDPATLQHANLILLWGANIAECRLGSEWEARIREARRRGVDVVVIDPRCTASVRSLATRWIPVRPGTDSALMMAILYVLIQEGLVDLDFVERYSVGYAELKSHILGTSDGEPKTPAWAEALCGTPAATIVELARLHGQTKPAALLPGLSIQRTIGGEEAVRMAIALQVATGNLGRLGGSSGAFAQDRLPKPRMGSIPVPVREGGVPPIPVYRWADAVLEGRAGGYPSDIKAVYSAGGNYVVQGADVQKNMRALDGVEFAVCHDLFLTPTARYADVVLPATTFLERQDIVFASGNYVLFSNRAVDPLPGSRNDYDIYCDLAERLGFGAAYSEGKDEEGWLRSFVAESDVPDYDEFRRTGIHWAPDQMRVGLASFVADPAAHPLRTPSGRVELASQAYAAQTGFSAVPECRILPADARYPLRLITPKPRLRIHSQGANIPWFVEREGQQLWIHPLDAGPRGIADGQQVLVSSPEGRVRVPARVCEEIMPGVVSLLEGTWPEFDEEGVDIAGSANVLTSSEPTMPSQGSRTHSVLVEVTLAHGGER
jgi:anaerobic dimethyl sulfoxide reductase subunit A